MLVTGDAYIDHPAFGIAVIGRVLQHQGYRVGIIAVPDWRDVTSIMVFGRPRLFFGVTSGNVDSMVSRYTAFQRYRSDDPYAPGGRAGLKPERAVIVYCNLIKSVYKNVPIVIGGIEASLRRIVHYDFWSNRLRRSILADSRADVLVYGMGEKQISIIAERCAQNRPLDSIPGTVIMANTVPQGAVLLPSEEEVLASPEQLVTCYRLFYRHQHQVLAQPTGGRYLVHYPPPEMSRQELDAIYALPFERAPHPAYVESIPALNMIQGSITCHRGCVSGCSFCSLTLHQGKRIVSRSPESVLQEARIIAARPDFKGHITDIGGPSANNYGFECHRGWHCSRESCTFPELCKHLKFGTDHWITLLEQASKIKRVAKVTVGSGIRYDLFMSDPDGNRLLKKLIQSHISGQLKIAPEHSSPVVLRAMRKAPLYPIKDFIQTFRDYSARTGTHQHLLPYLMSCHPGCRIEDMRIMKTKIRSDFGFIPKQVQAFIPLPMTLSSIMYYTGVDPLTGERFYVARDRDQRRRQHEIFFTRR